MEFRRSKTPLLNFFIKKIICFQRFYAVFRYYLLGLRILCRRRSLGLMIVYYCYDLAFSKDFTNFSEYHLD